MTDQQIQNLFYLVHEKSHIMKPGTVSPVVADLVDTCRHTVLVTLYRGISKEDKAFLDDIIARGDMFRTWPCCLSFSEDKNVARSFASGYGTKAIMRVFSANSDHPPKGLNVCGQLAEHVNRHDESEMDMLRAAREEKEWIFNQPRVMITKHKTEKDGLEVYNVTMITL